MLESIRDLMNEDTVMPDWLHDIFLGYGDPAQAKYTHMPADQLLQTIDFKVLLLPWFFVLLNHSCKHPCACVLDRQMWECNKPVKHVICAAVF